MISLQIVSYFNFANDMVYLTRVEHFNAAHKLSNPNWTAERNKEVFGPCANANWHGHNYELQVTIKGIPDAETGFVMDVKKLGECIRENVIEKLDHKNLNVDVDFMAGKMASTELLVLEIWKQLEPKLPKGLLHRIRLYETSKIFADYYGDALVL